MRFLKMEVGGVFSSYSIDIIPSKYLHSFLKNKVKDEDVPSALKKNMEEYFEGVKQGNDRISVSFLRDLATYLEDAGTGIHFHELMVGSDLKFPSIDPPPRDPNLEARIVKLKQQIAAKDYEHMTRNVDAARKHKYDNEFGKDVRIMRSHMAAGLNLVITVGACFLFGYKGLEYMLPAAHVPSQVLMGLIVGSIGALADLYFLVKHIDSSEAET